MNLEDIIQVTLTPTVDFLLDNGVKDVVDLASVIGLINQASTQFGDVASILLKNILTVKVLYNQLTEDENRVKKQRDDRYNELFMLYTRKDDENPNLKINTSQGFAEKAAKRDPVYVRFDEEVNRIKDVKRRLYLVKEMLEEELSVCKVIAQNPDRVRASGRVLTESDVEDYKELLESKLVL